ncbi:hypothetical protein [Kordia sp.]|uniref:hypothetical protein n=1 Tax=Kordia sp. TaxID=1965332 RepID=UPI003D265E78
MESNVKTKPFSVEWWENFKNNTGNMSFPVIRKRIFNNDIDELRESIFEMFQNLKHEKEALAWRVWLDGEINPDLEKQIVADPMKSEADFSPWCQRNFGDKKFGIILNDGQRYSKKTRDLVSKYFEPILEKKPPLGGINFSIFVGNYGWTPIGIHQDHTGSFVMHLHLGPGTKEMFMWEQKHYKNTLNGRENEMEIEQYLPFTSYDYSFESGDIFFMPWNFYHVGRSEEISIGLTVWFNYTTVDGLFNGIYSSGIKEIISDIEDPTLNEIVQLKNYKDCELDAQIENLLQSVDEDVLNSTFSEFMEDQIQDYTNALISNDWYDRGAIKEKLELAYDLPDDQKVSLIISPMRYVKHNDVLKIFHRADKIDLAYHEDVVSLIERINERKIDTVENLIQGLFSDWPEGIGKRIVEIFVENCVLQMENK